MTESQFIKVYKTKAYYKRYQTKFRRRREGKTDYYQRRRLVAQNKTKYNSPKYRLVVRITNTDVITQIVYSKIIGDVVIASAYSHELPRYGVSVGLTNYSAVYCTGLLLARRLLQKLGMDSLYEGKKDVDGNYFIVDDLKDRRAFQAYLDVGLARTTSGARIFAAVKGACDGGLYVPHSARRFPGYNQDKEEYDPKIHRARIFGAHVSKYMKYLQSNDDAKYKKQFSKFIAAGVTAESLESLYSKAHAAIRADPSHKKSDKPTPAVHSTILKKKQSLKQRKYRVQLKKQKLLRQIAAHQDN